MGVKYIHYTSRRLAQEIFIARRLRPASSLGRIYFTQDTYPNGATAAARLSIVAKPVEMCCILDGAKVEEALENPGKPKHVEPVIGPDGSDIRHGCGLEYFTKPGRGISVDPDQDHWLNLPVP